VNHPLSLSTWTRSLRISFILCDDRVSFFVTSVHRCVQCTCLGLERCGAAKMPLSTKYVIGMLEVSQHGWEWMVLRWGSVSRRMPPKSQSTVLGRFVSHRQGSVLSASPQAATSHRTRAPSHSSTDLSSPFPTENALDTQSVSPPHAIESHTQAGTTALARNAFLRLRGSRQGPSKTFVL
jgi:hypothetical protein